MRQFVLADDKLVPWIRCNRLTVRLMALSRTMFTPGANDSDELYAERFFTGFFIRR